MSYSSEINVVSVYIKPTIELSKYVQLCSGCLLPFFNCAFRAAVNTSITLGAIVFPVQHIDSHVVYDVQCRVDRADIGARTTGSAVLIYFPDHVESLRLRTFRSDRTLPAYIAFKLTADDKFQMPTHRPKRDIPELLMCRLFNPRRLT